MKNDELEERAARFLMRREEPDWSDKDQSELDAWLDQSMAHKAAFWRLEHGWSYADRLASLGQQMPTVTRWTRKRIVSIAASIAVLIGAAGMWQTLNTKSEFHAEYRTAIGEHKKIPLKDGSVIEMNTNTDIRVEFVGHRRLVWLDRGEIYAEVAHDSRRPFVVNAGIRTITDLGTKFVVWRNGDTITVPVVEGSVQLDGIGDATAAAPTVVTGNHVATAFGSSTLVVAKSPDNIQDSLVWRRGMLSFRDMTLADAVAEFNRYNRKQLIVTDPDTAHIRIGGVFRVSNVDVFTNLLQRAFGLKVESTNEVVKISKR